MSLRPREMAPVPEETARIAHAAFPKGNMLMRLRDELGAIYQDERFAALYPKRGQPAQTPWRLALVLVMQFAEGLSDRQAAEAVRSRIDWKYALALELTDSGFDSTVLSEFRTRLVEGSAEQAMLDALLDTCREKKWLAGRGRQRTDSTHVLGAIRALNRLECVGEAMRHALNSLAVAAPDWLREQIQPEWKDRYGPRVEDYRLPKSQPDRQAHAELIGADGYALLDRIYAVNAPSWLRQVPAIETLRRIWLQQYYRTETQTCWRTEQEGLPPSARFLNSPYDPDAHYAKKRSTSWVGYKVHLTETCDDDRPHLITHVETTAAPMADSDAMEPIHGALAATDLLPSVHLVDTGYVDAKLLVSSRGEHDVDLLGPARVDDHWQAQEAKGFAASCRLRRELLRHRLGATAGHLSRGTGQRQLDASARSPRPPRPQDQVLQCGLRRMPSSPRLHAIRSCPPDADGAAAGAIRCSASRPSAAGNRGVCRAVQQAGGHRGDPLPSCADVRPAARPLSGAG